MMIKNNESARIKERDGSRNKLRGTGAGTTKPKANTDWHRRMAFLEGSEKRRKKNLKEAKAILKYIPKHGVDCAAIVVRIEDILKEYVEDLKYEHEG